MKNIMIVMMLMAGFSLGCGQQKEKPKEMKTFTQHFKKLTPEEERVIIHKGTERPFTGKYDDFFENGIYVCKQCGYTLYESQDKFHSGCGWPSFDDEVPGAVKRVTDADGRRTEILCTNCGGHLGHVFTGEGYTPKNTRHCVNSISLEFIPADKAEADHHKVKTDTAIFAGGCFWGVEYYMEQAKGVISAESGYIGGNTDDPSYKEVCSHTTGHAEAVQVIFDPGKTDYETLARLFFEIHDPTQLNRQGPDVGDQYRSEVFYLNFEQKAVTEKLIRQLKDNELKVVTKVTKAGKFWKAEDYHQNYYEHKNGTPYCHFRVKRF